MVGRGNRASVSPHAGDRHLMAAPMKTQMRSSTPVDRTRQSPPHASDYDNGNINSNSSPVRGITGASRIRNRSTSPNRVKMTTSGALTGSNQPRARLMYTRTRSGDTRDPAPVSAVSNKYEEAAGEAVCDYDTSATVLYELLESSSWERARSRCRSHPDEVRTWIVRKDKSLQVRWKLLPLHAAIIFQAPNFLVSALLEKYSSAASRKDDQGMLPLHLAFRHKQEDEDLLEVLLVHFPKAVTIKDRRDRVPLEHGRDSKFSAKLMRLYADANVAAAKAGGVSNAVDIPPSEETGKERNLTGGQRAILEAEYKEKILALKVDYEKQMRKMKAQLAEELAESDQKNQERILAVKDEYEEELSKMKEAQERRLASIHDHHQNAIRQSERSRDEERQATRQQYLEEVSDLRNVLASQVAKDKELTDTLEKEIAHLQLNLQEKRTDCELARGEYDQLQVYNNEMRDVFQKVTTHQSQLQELIAKQQEEIEGHRNSRYKLIQTLLRHEDDHSESELQQISKMIELCEKTARKIDYAREKRMLPEGDVQEEPVRQEIGRRYDRVEARVDSRMDRERESEQDLLQESSVHDDVERERNRIDRDPFQHDVPKDSGKVHEYVDPMSPTGKSKEQEYGEVRILADEISAITENSDF